MSYILLISVRTSDENTLPGIGKEKISLLTVRNGLCHYNNVQQCILGRCDTLDTKRGKKLYNFAGKKLLFVV